MTNPVPDWVHRADSPPEVDDGPWPNEELTAQTSRDTVLLCIAGMVIIAILAFVAGTRA